MIGMYISNGQKKAGMAIFLSGGSRLDSVYKNVEQIKTPLVNSGFIFIV
jgi:hypothetical protein